MNTSEEGGGRRVYVLYTNVIYMDRIRQQIEKFLLEDDEEIYSPRIDRIKRIKGRDRHVMSYMFPGYLFIETSHPGNLYFRIMEGMGEVIFHYCRMLKADLYICPILPGEQREISRLCNREHVLESSTGYIAGDELVITDGPLKDYTGRIIRIDRHKKAAVISCTLMGSEKHVTVGLEVVRKIRSGGAEGES